MSKTSKTSFIKKIKLALALLGLGVGYFIGINKDKGVNK